MKFVSVAVLAVLLCAAVRSPKAMIHLIIIDNFNALLRFIVYFRRPCSLSHCTKWRTSVNYWNVLMVFLVNWLQHTKNWNRIMPNSRLKQQKSTWNWTNVKKPKILSRKMSKSVLKIHDIPMLTFLLPIDAFLALKSFTFRTWESLEKNWKWVFVGLVNNSNFSKLWNKLMEFSCWIDSITKDYWLHLDFQSWADAANESIITFALDWPFSTGIGIIMAKK